MNAIHYTHGGPELLDTIQTLWEALNQHHAQNAGPFRQAFQENTFATRRDQLLAKAQNGQLRVDLAQHNKRPIGYCITTLIPPATGEIESLYIEETHRQNHIGATLIQKALTWLDQQGATKKRLAVATGNEQALPFYKKFGFHPRLTILEQIETPPK